MQKKSIRSWPEYPVTKDSSALELYIFCCAPFFFIFYISCFIYNWSCLSRKKRRKKRGQVSCARRRSREGSKRGIGSSHFTFRPTSTCAPSQLLNAIALFTSAYVLFFYLFREQALKTTAAAKYFVLNDLIYLWWVLNLLFKTSSFPF